MKTTHKFGSYEYGTIAEEEVHKVCDEFANDIIDGEELYRRYAGQPDRVQWPGEATDKEIRAASRENMAAKLTAAGLKRP